MSFGAYILPSARRTGSEELRRYVRAEYRETDPCWLTAQTGNGRCLGASPGAKRASKTSQQETIRTADGACASCVTELKKSVAARGGTTGNR